MSKKRVLTWHIHGSYLYYLTQVDCLFYIPVSSKFQGKTKNFPWGKNVLEIPAERIRDMDFDCIIFQSNFNPQDPSYEYLQDQFSMLSPHQLQYIPKLFIEHDPPRLHPTDTKHPLFDSDITIVHVTPFNKLMWDTGSTKTQVIQHGVKIPENVLYSGTLAKGVVVINNLHARGRRLGLDIFEYVREKIPLDLVGMGSEKLGGIGEVSPKDLPSFISQYRFFFHPARYTSLGLAVLEAMMIGLPVVGLATTELPMVIQSKRNGYISTDLEYLLSKMKLLLDDSNLAKKLGQQAKIDAQKRYGIKRFTSQWEEIIKTVSLKRSDKNNNQVHTVHSSLPI